MSFNWKVVVGTIIGFFGAAFGSVGGVGGGGIFVPMLTLIIELDENSATIISKYSNPLKPRWDCAINVDVLGVELAKSAVQLPLVWNIQVSTWLRHYVYERLIQKGRKPGFFQLLGTQTISAVWHGLYPGYLMFFVQSALMIAGSKGTGPSFYC